MEQTGTGRRKGRRKALVGVWKTKVVNVRAPYPISILAACPGQPPLGCDAAGPVRRQRVAGGAGGGAGAGAEDRVSCRRQRGAS